MLMTSNNNGKDDSLSAIHLSLITHHDEDYESGVENQIITSMKAAVLLENNKVRPLVCKQEDMLAKEFPAVPVGEVAKELTKKECINLQASM